MKKNRLIIAGIVSALIAGCAITLKEAFNKKERDSKKSEKKSETKRNILWNYEETKGLSKTELQSYNRSKIDKWYDDVTDIDSWSYMVDIMDEEEAMDNDLVISGAVHYISKQPFLVLGELKCLVQEIENKTIYNETAILKALNTLYKLGYIDYRNKIDLSDTVITGEKLVFLSYPNFD